MRIFLLPRSREPVEVEISNAERDDESEQYRLVTNGEVTVIEDGRGGVIPFERGWLKARIDSDDRRDDDDRVIIGWAFDGERVAPLDLIFVFGADGGLLQAVPPKLERLDIAGFFGVKGITPAGFSIVIDGSDAAGVRLVAFARGKADEIELE